MDDCGVCNGNNMDMDDCGICNGNNDCYPTAINSEIIINEEDSPLKKYGKDLIDLSRPIFGAPPLLNKKMHQKFWRFYTW